MANMSRTAKRNARHLRVRQNLYGTPDKPRMAVFRSNKNISVQIIDDVSGTTLVAASSLDKDIKADFANGGNKEVAKAVGKSIGEKALAKGIETVAFDRGGNLYHGRVKELADGAREAGLKF